MKENEGGSLEATSQKREVAHPQLLWVEVQRSGPPACLTCPHRAASDGSASADTGTEDVAGDRGFGIDRNPHTHLGLVMIPYQ